MHRQTGLVVHTAVLSFRPAHLVELELSPYVNRTFLEYPLPMYARV